MTATPLHQFRFLPLILGSLLTLLLFGPAHAAPDTRHVSELDAHPVRIYYENDEKRVAERVAEICEELMDELCGELGLRSSPPIEIDIVDDVGRYRRRFGGDMPRWGVAFALMGEGRMVVDAVRATRAWNQLESVIPHELSHLLVGTRTAGTPLPVWFLEGLAQWQAGEWSLVDGWQLMNAVWSNKAPKLWRLQNQYPSGEEEARSAYRVSYAAFTFLFKDRTGDLPAFLDEVVKKGSFNDAFESFFDEHPMTFYVRFHEQLHARYKSRLLVFQTGPLFSILAAAFFVVALRYYFRKRRRLREMADGPRRPEWSGGDGPDG